MAGRYNFNIPGRPDASIVNRGTITASSGGFAALVAPGVRNSGTITATLGTVALASGNGTRRRSPSSEPALAIAPAAWRPESTALRFNGLASAS